MALIWVVLCDSPYERVFLDLEIAYTIRVQPVSFSQTEIISHAQ